MKVSVVMPAYNAETTIAGAIESILGQSFKDFEFIIIDDGSVDSTEKIIKDYAQKDKRIKLYKNKFNKGVTGALNTGVIVARGEYIARMDSDDISLPQRFETQVKFMDNNPEIGVAGSWYENFGEIEGVKKLFTDPEQIKVYMILHGAIAHPTAMFRRKLFLDNNLLYNLDFTYGQDYDLWVRASEVTKVSNVAEVLLKYRIHKKNVGSQHSLIQRRSVETVQRRIIHNLGIYPTYQEMEIHYALASWNSQTLTKILPQVLAWMQKIIAYNHVKNIYNEKILFEFLYNELLNSAKSCDETFVNKVKSELLSDNRESFIEKLSKELYREEEFYNQDNPSISVVMPAYNSEKYLSATIESILNQTYKNFEFLVINDGSTDSTEEIVKAFMLKDQRVKLINNKFEKGIVGGLNTGLEESKGKYIARMDSDDIAFAERLEKQLNFMEKNTEIGLCGTWYQMFGKYEGAMVLPKDSDTIRATMLFHGPIAHPTVMFRKSVIRQNNLKYSQEHIWIEDIELWYRMSKVTKLANFPEILLWYRTHEESIGSTRKVIQAEKVAKLHLQMLTELGLTPSEAELSIHEKIGNGDFSEELVFLWNTKIWFNKILDQNRKAGIYSQSALIAFLTSKLTAIYIFTGYRSLRRVLFILKFFLLRKNLKLIIRIKLLGRLFFSFYQLQFNGDNKKNKNISKQIESD